MNLTVLRADRGDEWYVAFDGRHAIGFSGPDAQARAERHKQELAELLGAGSDDGARTVESSSETPHDHGV